MSSRSLLISILCSLLLNSLNASGICPKYLQQLMMADSSRARSAPPRMRKIFDEFDSLSETSQTFSSESDIWWLSQPYLDIQSTDGLDRYYCREIKQNFGVEVYYNPSPHDIDVEIVSESIRKGSKSIEDVKESLRIQRQLSSYHYFAKLASASLEDDICYTLLLFCPSLSFQKILASLPFYLAQLIDAMDILSELQIVYGGLSMDNVRLRENGYLKLAGFENSFKSERTTRKSVITRSPWIAPELLLFGSATAASNWYSLAAFVYELTTSQKFNPDDIVFPDDLDASLKQIIADLSTKDSHRRHLRSLGIKKYPIFEGIDWDQLRAGELEAPIKFKFDD